MTAIEKSCRIIGNGIAHIYVLVLKSRNTAEYMR